MNRVAVAGAAAAAALAAAGAGVLLLRDGDAGGPSAQPFAGAWDVSLVVGAVDADPEADPVSFPGDATFRERWVFEGCGDDACTLRRPDGGLLLGDLDGVEFRYRAIRGIDDEERFSGEGTGEEPAPVGEVDEDHADPCLGTPARRWRIRIEVGLRERVLSGTILRTPEERRVDVDGTTCFGLDLTLGFSGVPAAAGGPQASG